MFWIVQRKVASILEFVSVVEPCTEKIISIDIESGLDAVFKQESLKAEANFDGQKPELHALEIDEAGYVISAASRLLTKLLDFEHFRPLYSAPIPASRTRSTWRIISEGVVDSTRAVSAKGGIFPLVKLIENGTDRAVDTGLAILYNLFAGIAKCASKVSIRKDSVKKQAKKL
nr:Coatomer beta subunit [Ipomoea batatas]